MRRLIPVAGIILLELTYALEITVFTLLYAPLDLAAAERSIIGGNAPFGTFTAILASIGLVLLPVLRKADRAAGLNDQKFMSFVIRHGIFTLLIWLKYGAFLFNYRYHFLALIAAGAAVYLLFRLGERLFRSGQPAWQHPTTIGSVFISGLVMAAGICMLTDAFSEYRRSLLIWLAVLLLFEIPVLFARFRFLTHTNAQLKNVAARLLGENILIFGGHIIAGIFIPLVFICFSVWIQPVPEQGITILVIMGVLFERYLFLTVTAEADTL